MTTTNTNIIRSLKALRDGTLRPREANTFPEVGAIYDVVLDVDAFAQWLVLYPPREDGWVLVVPVDLVPLMGRSDYRAPTELGNVVTLRASRSTWLWPELITGRQPVDRLEETFDLERVRGLALGGLGAGAEDATDGLIRWNAQLDKVAVALERRLEREAPEVPPIIPASVIRAWRAGELSADDAAKVGRYISDK